MVLKGTHNSPDEIVAAFILLLELFITLASISQLCGILFPEILIRSLTLAQYELSSFQPGLESQIGQIQYCQDPANYRIQADIISLSLITYCQPSDLTLDTEFFPNFMALDMCFILPTGFVLGLSNGCLGNHHKCHSPECLESKSSKSSQYNIRTNTEVLFKTLIF